tara:strand:+ start:899 stop:1138 length:240 start_codon:yes stop_codon:yes gene_type:complete
LRSLSLAFGAALSLLAGCSEAPQDCPLNPSIVDIDSTTSPIHDPTIIRHVDDYYVFSSSALGSFYRSPDLVTWQSVGDV